MSQPEDRRGEPRSEADRTLLGVAPPRFESVESSARSPVLVRAGDSVADQGDAARPRVALPSRPQSSSFGSAPESAAESPGQRARRVAREVPALWMVGAPALAALGLIGMSQLFAPPPAPRVAPAVSPVASGVASPATSASPAPPPLTELASKPPGTLSAAELVQLAEGKGEERLRSLRALRDDVAKTPSLLANKPVQVELLQAARDARTAPLALLIFASARTPLGADLLYEVWSSTPQRTDATELSRALLASPDVSPAHSPALAVALALRGAETCEQVKAVLPKALQDGDRRSLVPLAKLTSRRGCGPKKTDDCYACLRAEKDELAATMSAVKSRRAPVFPSAP
jgi:hypothetical protein